MGVVGGERGDVGICNAFPMHWHAVVALRPEKCLTILVSTSSHTGSLGLPIEYNDLTCADEPPISPDY